MDPTQQIAELGISLSEALLKNTATMVANKIQAVKAKKNDKETIKVLDEIIDNLQNDKSKLIQISQAYEQELVTQKISEKDIEYITTKFIPLLKTALKQLSVESGNNDTQALEKTLDTLTPLLLVETITVLQLIGFNFKKALGEPLTLLLQNLILSRASVSPQSTLEYNKLLVQQKSELVNTLRSGRIWPPNVQHCPQSWTLG
jgi:hypothetical protein